MVERQNPHPNTEEVQSEHLSKEFLEEKNIILYKKGLF
jgi:hypothetical protein